MDVTELAKVLGALPWYAVLVLGILFTVDRTLRWRETRAERRAKEDELRSKEERAARYEERMTKLIETIGNHDSGVKQCMTEVRDSLNDLAVRARNVLSLDATLGVVEAYFSNLSPQVQRLVETSLRENSYAGREDIVARKVRTLMADKIRMMRDQLRLIRALAVDPDHFCPVYINREGDGGERFVLVDKLWDTVVPLYEYPDHGADLTAQRIDDAKVRVENCVRDFYTDMAMSLRSDMSKAWTRKREESPSTNRFKRHRSGEFRE